MVEIWNEDDSPLFAIMPEWNHNPENWVPVHMPNQDGYGSNVYRYTGPDPEIEEQELQNIGLFRVYCVSWQERLPLLNKNARIAKIREELNSLTAGAPAHLTTLIYGKNAYFNAYTDKNAANLITSRIYNAASNTEDTRTYLREPGHIVYAIDPR
ncbi:MAG: hypothetical protein HY364_01350 [Candidatus Aenigmarchaeota archaeon]|nr:hypothetical protein [Candidatus Aenigmarchaeota archaeon]